MPMAPWLIALVVGSVSVETQKERGVDGIAVPLVNYNSDLGVGLGAVGGAYLYSPGYRPYRHSLAVQVFFTTRGVQNHWVRYDGPRLLGPVRLETRLEWRRELFAPYYGPGNRSEPGVVEAVSGELLRRYAYDRLSPGGWLRFRVTPLGDEHPLELYAGYGFRWNGVRPYDTSLVAEQQPVGISGGALGQLLAGVVWDTRDDEAVPSRGGAEELSLRGAAGVVGSRYTFGGVTFIERRFFSLSPRLVFGQRLMLDVLFGEVPFFEWVNTGGLLYAEGIGGMSSVRGVPRNRYAGTMKALSNSELRFDFYEFALWGASVRFGALASLDLGRAWHPAVDDGSWWTWHPGIGGGLRLTRRAAVVRVDYALATESRRQALYVTFGHMF